MKQCLHHSEPARVIKWLLVLAIVTPILVFAVAARQSYHSTVDAARERADHTTRLLVEHAGKTLEAIVLLLKYTDEKVSGLTTDEIASSHSLWSSIRDLLALAEQANAVYIVDETGTTALTTREFPPPSGDFSDRDYWIAQRDIDQGVYVSGSYIGRISNRNIFNLTIRKNNPEGLFKGVIGISVFTDYYENFYQTVGDRSDNPSVTLMRNDGVRLVGFPVDENATAMSDPSHWKEREQQGKGSYWSTNGGVERIYSFSRVPNFPIVVTYGIDRKAIMARWREHLVTWGSITLFVAIALSSFCLLALNRAHHESVALEKAQRTSADLLLEIQRREHAEDALRQSRKLDAMGQVTGGIAHDFNNLLMVILGGLRLAERRTDIDSIRKQLANVRFAAERAEQLTRQLLAFSRRQNLHPESIDLTARLNAYRSVLAQALGGNLKLDFDIAQDVWPINVDPGEFESALLNLAVNARDAMPDRGVLTVKAENVVIGLEDSKRKPGSYVHISLTDTGTGMAADTLSRVFEPFFTTKDVNKGTGLGMSQVHGFIQQSGGWIDIASTVGTGTTISLYLPKAAQCPTENLRSAETWPVELEGHILVVEDNEEVGEVIDALLKEAGFQTTKVATAATALRTIEDGRHFDLLLSDIVMPGGMNGVQLAQAVRRERPLLPIILMTGYAGISAREDIKDFTVVSKPVHPTALLQAIGAELARNHNLMATNIHNGPAGLQR